MNDEMNSATSRLFIGLPVAARLHSALTEICQRYGTRIKTTVPAVNWHITLVWLGEVTSWADYRERLLTPQLLAPLSQPFVPTVSITHVGRGHQPAQLWAYIGLSSPLLTLRANLLKRLQTLDFPLPEREVSRIFVPHIRLAQLDTTSGQVVIPDNFVSLRFSPAQVNLYRSLNSRLAGLSTKDGRRYSCEGSIALTP